MKRSAPRSAPLAARDRVRLAYAPRLRGVVVAAGPEQSEVRLDGERVPRAYVNEDLVKLPARAKSRRGEP